MEETRLKNFDWSRFEALHEEALKETGEFKFDAETWDTINRTDWSQVPTDPEAWACRKTTSTPMVPTFRAGHGQAVL